MAHVAVLGTGLLGAGFVEALRKRGTEVRVWNRTRAKAEGLRPLGVEVAATPAEAVRGAERVHLVLADDDAVDAVLTEAGDALSSVVVDHSTVSPAGVVARCARMGTRYVHAPVFMGPQNARDASGIMLVAGPDAAVQPLLPALQKMTGRLVHVGQRVDLAAAYKLFGNAMLITLVAGTSDVMAMARSLNVDPSDAIGLFSLFDPSPTIRVRGARIARQDFAAASFELTMAAKDVRLMREAAGDQPLVVLPSIAERMTALVADGHGDEDLAVIGRIG